MYSSDEGISVSGKIYFEFYYVRCEVKSIMDGFFIILRLKYTKYTLFVNLSNFQLQNFKSFFSEAGVPCNKSKRRFGRCEFSWMSEIGRTAG